MEKERNFPLSIHGREQNYLALPLNVFKLRKENHHVKLRRTRRKEDLKQKRMKISEQPPPTDTLRQLLGITELPSEENLLKTL